MNPLKHSMSLLMTFLEKFSVEQAEQQQKLLQACKKVQTENNGLARQLTELEQQFCDLEKRISEER
jgi:septal ring factor EnvC (AmiA/AmiB activator)